MKHPQPRSESMKICKSMLLASDPTIDLDRFSLRLIKPKVGFFKDLPRGLDFALLCFSELFKSVPPTIVGSLTLLSAQVATEKTPP